MSNPNYTRPTNLSNLLCVKFFDHEGEIRRKDYTEPEYAYTLASFAGLEYAKVDLGDLNEKQQDLLVRAMSTTGIDIAGKRYFLSFATGAAKSGLLYVTLDKSLGQRRYPKSIDAIRMAPLFTPCYNFMGRIAVSIMIVEDGEYGTADGQAVWGEKVVATTGWSLQAQFRAEMDIAFAKGTGYPKAELPADLVLPKSCVKGNIADLPAFFIAEIDFGLANVAERLQVKIGYQVTQFWPDEVWDTLRAEWVEIASKAHADAHDPLTFAKTHAEDRFRDENGKIGEQNIFHAAVNACTVIGNSDLMRSARIAETVEEVVSQTNIAACTSGNTVGIGGMALCDRAIEDGIVFCHPKMAAAGRAILLRYPHDHPTSAIPVRVLTDENCLMGSFYVNDKTGNPSGLDFDGDMAVIVPANRPHLKLWWEWLATLERNSEGKGRATGNPPSNHIDMIRQIMSVNVGKVANAQTSIWALIRKLETLPRPFTKKQALLIKTAYDLFEQTPEQIRRAVDSAKKAALPDMKFIAKITKFCKDNGLSEEDTGFKDIDNGTIKVWRQVDKDAYILPWEMTSDETPLGLAFHALGKELPQVRLSTHDNIHFVDWLPEIRGKGWDHAALCHERAQTRMNEIRHMPIEEQNEARKLLLTQWEQHWFKKLQSESHEWLEQAASFLWKSAFQSEKGRQYFLWYSLPEIIIGLLEQNASKIKSSDKAVCGIIVGSAFSGEGRYTVTVEESTRGARIRQCFRFSDGGLWTLSESTPKINRSGQFEITVKATGTPGRWAFVATGQTVKERKVIQILGEQK